MSKGQFGLITLFAIGVVFIVGFYFYNHGSFAPSSQIGGQSSKQFKNDVITIENLKPDNLSPYSGTVTSINFDVQNNADTAINGITVNFFDLPGFTIVDNGIDCGTGSRIVNSCKFDKIESLDSRHLKIALKANPVQSSTPYTISVSVSYTHNGVRQASIPVIDPQINRKPTGQFSQSTPTPGPVVFDIQPLISRPTLDSNNQPITETWGNTGDEFVTKFTMSEIGTVKGAFPVEIPIGKITLTPVKNLQPTTCTSFDTSGSSITNKAPVSARSNTLICAFKPTGDQSEYMGILKLEYTYNYQFIAKVDFVVQPSPK